MLPRSGSGHCDVCAADRFRVPDSEPADLGDAVRGQNHAVQLRRGLLEARGEKEVEDLGIAREREKAILAIRAGRVEARAVRDRAHAHDVLEKEGPERSAPADRRGRNEQVHLQVLLRRQEEVELRKEASRVDELVYVSQDDAEEMCRRLAREEGIFAGISAAGACWVAQEIAKQVENATIVFIVCDRGDRYLSTGVFPA